MPNIKHFRNTQTTFAQVSKQHTHTQTVETCTPLYPHKSMKKNQPVVHVIDKIILTLQKKTMERKKLGGKRRAQLSVSKRWVWYSNQLLETGKSTWRTSLPMQITPYSSQSATRHYSLPCVLWGWTSLETRVGLLGICCFILILICNN